MCEESITSLGGSCYCKHPSRVLNGNVSSLNSKDCLLYNMEENKLMACVGLKGVIAVNTEDALLVVSKEEVVNISNLIKSLEDEGKTLFL